MGAGPRVGVCVCEWVCEWGPGPEAVFIPARALLLRVLDDSTIRRKKFGSTGIPLEARPGGRFYFSGPCARVLARACVSE